MLRTLSSLLSAIAREVAKLGDLSLTLERLLSWVTEIVNTREIAKLDDL